MTNKVWWDCLLDVRTRRFITISAIMIGIGLGLEIYAILLHGPTTLGGMLLVLLLALWSGLIGILGFGLVTVLLVTRARTNCREEQVFGRL